MAVILVARLRAAAWNADDAGLPGHPLAHRWHAAHPPASHIAFPAICEALLLTLHAAAELDESSGRLCHTWQHASNICTIVVSILLHSLAAGARLLHV